MTTPKRIIKAKPLVRDVRDGMSDRKLMEKYSLSHYQLQKVFQRLVDAGAIDEMEIFIRTSLDDSTIIKALAQTQKAVPQNDNLDEITPAYDLKVPTDITVTEKVKSLGKTLGGMLFKFGRTA